jgi:hypothetical protein
MLVRRFPVAVVLAVAAPLVLPVACTPLPRDAACVAAEACDQALEEPFGSFGADDTQFGDAGTCWLTADTAKPCITACADFLAEQVATFDADGDGVAEDSTQQAVVDACSG